MVAAVSVAIGVLLLVIHGSLTGYVYLDAADHGMAPRTWALVTLAVPFFGLFTYLFEREERTPSPDAERRDELFVDGAFQVHESRAEDAPWIAGDGDGESDDEDRST